MTCWRWCVACENCDGPLRVRRWQVVQFTPGPDGRDHERGTFMACSIECAGRLANRVIDFCHDLGLTGRVDTRQMVYIGNMTTGGK